jgi:8-oxo-dGTP pyrophosphatase MutT (NUDIX family)
MADPASAEVTSGEPANVTAGEPANVTAGEPANVTAGEPAVRGGLQQIPRPARVRLGAAPPWADLPVDRRRGIGLAEVEAALARRGPSVPVPATSPQVELPGLDRAGNRPAAVLCALFEEEGEARVILTRRSSRLRSHTGEVSFPGGRLDPDEMPVAAALREASEEVGLDPEAVEILGQLSPLSTYSNQSTITPFVGVLGGRPALHPNPAEVERAFDVSLAELASDDVYHQELWELPGVGWREINFFDLVGDTVWGATARMLRELLVLVLEPGLV